MQILSERPVIRQKKKLIMVWLGGPMISEDIGMLYFICKQFLFLVFQVNK